MTGDGGGDCIMNSERKLLAAIRARGMDCSGYYLSAKACAGVLRRAERRGKTLPKMLREALEEAVALGA